MLDLGKGIGIICGNPRSPEGLVNEIVMELRRNIFYILSALVLAANPALPNSYATASSGAQVFVGQDLYLEGTEVVSCQLSEAEPSFADEPHRGGLSLVFERGFSMSIGGNKYSSRKAVVWLKQSEVETKAMVYLSDEIKIEKSSFAKTTGLQETVLEKGKKVIVELATGGEIFITADKQQTIDNREMEIYKEALSAVLGLPRGPRFVVQERALVPQWQEQKPTEEKTVAETVKPKEEFKEAIAEAKVEKVSGEPSSSEAKRIHYRYPVNLAPAGEVSPKIEKFTLADGTEVATVIGRIYVWQKQNEAGRLLELQADSAVVFYTRGKADKESGQGVSGSVLTGGSVQAIYMSGDVIVTEGSRTIRAEEIYYDFIKQKAVIMNTVFRTFDEQRGIPIYVRAVKFRQESANKFSTENAVVTSSEFCKPQISLTAGDAEITDTTVVDAETGKASDKSFEAQMRDVRLKVGDTTIFYWPKMTSDSQRPDVPLKRIRVGSGNVWGTSVETQWYLSRLLGLREPQGTKSTFDLDYYSNRGVGAGAEIEYEREDYFGKVLGYIIDDNGADRLGRIDSRRNLEPPRDLRGRFQVQHRQFLPYNWQITTELSYLSDKHFLESYYPDEFDTGKQQETLVHLKRIEDNWAISLLGKARINDFMDELEELPSFEYHRTGESLFEDMFTLYSDTELSRLRQRVGKGNFFAVNEDFFTYVSHRTELDLPLRFNTAKVVPYIAGTFGYDDRSGFTRGFVDGSNTGDYGQSSVGTAEGGVRAGTEFWKVFPCARSRLWDVNGLRHVVEPEITAAVFAESDSVVKQHDIVNLALSQRLQTKRGPADKQRTVDWMRLDTEITFVRDSESEQTAQGAPNRFMWNQPMIPMRVFSHPNIFNDDIQDLPNPATVEVFGPGRNYFGFNYIWRVSDTFAVLSDGYYDILSGVVQQYNIGIARLVWPNLSYYIGSRYLRSVGVLEEKGSNAFVFSATYEIDPRYTIIFSQQYDFDYEASIRSDITLTRRYHRLFYGLTFSANEALDEQAIVFSIWPQGVPELGIGSRRYVK